MSQFSRKLTNCLDFRSNLQISKVSEIINLTFCKQVEVNEAWWCHNLAFFLSHFLNPFWKHLSFSGFYGRNYCNWKIAAVPCISRRLSNALDFCLTATRLSLHRWAKKKDSGSWSTSRNGLSLLLPSSSKLLNLPRGDLWTLIEDSILQMNATFALSS